MVQLSDLIMIHCNHNTNVITRWSDFIGGLSNDIMPNWSVGQHGIGSSHSGQQLHITIVRICW